MDELERRREARRRKILLNSEDRLNRISGVENKTSCIELRLELIRVIIMYFKGPPNLRRQRNNPQNDFYSI